MWTLSLGGSIGSSKDRCLYYTLIDSTFTVLPSIDPDTVAVVVMPELIFRGRQRLLHNQRALYIKRLLLFEERVILTAVPYRLN